jgi:segregation and condensation protein B
MNQRLLKDEQIKAFLVALLFIKGGPIGIRSLSKILEEKKERVEKALQEAKKDLNILGLDLFSKKNLYQITTHSSASPFVNKLIKKEKGRPLGEAAWEVLSVVAYLGPVSLEKIELIRGVNSTKALRDLRIRGLIEKKSNDYRATLKLLKSLGVSNQEELEDYQLLRENEKIKDIF